MSKRDDDDNMRDAHEGTPPHSPFQDPPTPGEYGFAGSTPFGPPVNAAPQRVPLPVQDPLPSGEYGFPGSNPFGPPVNAAPQRVPSSSYQNLHQQQPWQRGAPYHLPQQPEQRGFDYHVALIRRTCAQMMAREGSPSPPPIDRYGFGDPSPFRLASAPHQWQQQQQQQQHIPAQAPASWQQNAPQRSTVEDQAGSRDRGGLMYWLAINETKCSLNSNPQLPASSGQCAGFRENGGLAGLRNQESSGRARPKLSAVTASHARFLEDCMRRVAAESDESQRVGTNISQDSGEMEVDSKAPAESSGQHGEGADAKFEQNPGPQ